MTSNTLETLKINKTFEIKSSVTGELYLDEDRRSYLFLNMTDAKKFVINQKNAEIAPPAYHDAENYLKECYKKGTTTLVLDNGRQKKEILLARSVVGPGYYNSDLNAWLSLLKTTGKEVYFQKIAASHFVVPIRVKFELTQEIVYATARQKNGSQAYVAFSDLDEYLSWSEKFAGWDPLVVNFDVLCQISKGYGILVNPLSKGMSIPAQYMEKYRKFTNKEEPII